MKRAIHLSIIIVSFNTCELTRACLKSVRATRNPTDSWEIIVVDNASGDGSADMVKKEFPDVHLVREKENIGFAKANNVGIRLSTGRYVLLLNSDTEVQPGSIQMMLHFMETHDHIGLATCVILLPNGQMDPACHRGFPTPWAALTYFSGLETLFPTSRIFGTYHLGYLPADRPHQIDSPSGAFFLTRRDVIKEVGLLDEAYFMYGEDIDWAYRVKEKGWEVWYNPAVSILHRKKQSGRAQQDKGLRQKTQKYFYETMWLFYKKHYMHRYPPLVNGFVWFAVRIKLFLVAL